MIFSISQEKLNELSVIQTSKIHRSIVQLITACVGYQFPCSLIVFSFEADGSPVSVRKFKAIFETHQYSAAERNQEPGTQYIILRFDRVMSVLLRGLLHLLWLG